MIDTTPLVGIFSEDERFHDRCGAVLRTIKTPLLTCWPVVTEAAWFLRSRPRSLYQLLSSLDGHFLDLLPLDAGDVSASVALMKRYESAGLQLADAALAHLADREGLRTVFTFDRRDFSIIRIGRDRALEIIPDLE